MKFFKRLVGLLGLGSNDVNKEAEDENHINGNNDLNSVEGIDHYSHLPRKGFSVSVQVPVNGGHQVGPILVPCSAGDGGVQGLGWYTRRLKIDEDGDVADEFLDEVLPDAVPDTEGTPHSTVPKFKVKLSTKPAKARNPRLSQEGTIKQYVEFRGTLQLV